MDTDKTRAPTADSFDAKPIIRRQFVLTRDVTDEELGLIYRYVPADEVDFFVQFRFGSSRGLVNYVRFERWYNLPVGVQTILRMILPCKG